MEPGTGAANGIENQQLELSNLGIWRINYASHFVRRLLIFLVAVSTRHKKIFSYSIVSKCTSL